MLIREAVADDLRCIAILFAQLGYPTTPQRLAARLAAAQAGENVHVLVAPDGAVLAGVAVLHVMTALHLPAPSARLSALVVDQGRRSGGVGAALLQAAEAWALAAGCTQLELTSNEARTRAHQFYERHGYREKRVRFVKALGP